jgi:hypothetical protein
LLPGDNEDALAYELRKARSMDWGTGTGDVDLKVDEVQ